MLKYDEYILESNLTELLLEAKISYKSDFIRILNDLKDDRIAEKLLKLQNLEVGVPQDNISLGEKNDMILFTPINKKLPTEENIVGTKARIINGNTFNEDISTFNKVYPNWNAYICHRTMDIGTTGTILSVKEYDGETLVFFLSDRGIGCILNIRSIEYLIPPVSMSVGRFVNRLLTVAGVKFDNKELETFVNKFKAQYDIIINDVYKDLKLVSGIDIRKYYLSAMYSPVCKGPLWNSCMRSKNCQEYFDIYVENPDKIQMLILMEGDKIKGRALVWKLDKPNKIFMDRIYTIYDSDVDLFIGYAKKNNWLYKRSQNSSLDVIDDTKIVSCKLYSSETDFSFLSAMQYPYMDTMCYLSNTGYLTNNKDEVISNSDRFYYELRQTDGTYRNRFLD